MKNEKVGVASVFDQGKSGREGQGERQRPAPEGSGRRNLGFVQRVKRSHLRAGSHG